MHTTIKQAIKFVLVGILNTLVDLGALNLLMFASGIVSGLGYTAFKGFSFTLAVLNSYFLNKFWTFKGQGAGKSPKQFTQFFIVSLIGFGINVGVASLVVNVMAPQFSSVFSECIGMEGGVQCFTKITPSPRIWANIGAICATFAAMTWNFIGYKFIVFKQNEQSGSLS